MGPLLVLVGGGRPFNAVELVDTFDTLDWLLFVLLSMISFLGEKLLLKSCFLSFELLLVVILTN